MRPDTEELELERSLITDIAIEKLGVLEASARPGEEYFYHSIEHTVGVRRRARIIGEAFELSPRELLLVDIAAAFHDVVQHWTFTNTELTGPVMRKRSAGRNEVASAQCAVEAMHVAPTPVIYSAEEVGLVASAIMATIPEWCDKYQSVRQPFLNRGSHAIVRAVAYADLGEAAMEPEAFAKSGLAIFAEDNLDVMRYLATVRSANDLHEQRRTNMRERLLDWLATQPQFALGRQTIMNEEDLRGLGDVRWLLKRQVLNRFDDSVALAKEMVRTATTLEFVPLMRLLNPNAFPDDG